jgi:RNA polymerase sigma-B factor
MSAATERALLERWHLERDEAARAELVERLLPFVRRIAIGYAGRGEPLDDLIQVGSVGLVNAIDRFDLSRGLRLTTFAAPNISGEIKRHFRDRSWAVRVPRELQELHAKIGRVSTKLGATLGRSPTVMELAEELEVSEELILEAMDAGRNYRSASLDAPQSDDDERPAAEALGTTETGFESAEQRAVLERGLDALAERERQIVLLRFGKGLSQREIATQVGLSQMHVSRLLRRSIEEMRATIGPPEGDC